MTDKEKAEGKAVNEWVDSIYNESVREVFETAFYRGYLSACSDKDKDIEELVECITQTQEIVNGSFGVSEHHLNGDIAQWDEFECIQLMDELLNKHK